MDSFQSREGTAAGNGLNETVAMAELNCALKKVELFGVWIMNRSEKILLGPGEKRFLCKPIRGT